MVVEARGYRVLGVHDVIVADPVEFAGADPWLNVRFDHLQHLGGKTAGDAHFFDFVRGFNRNSHE